MRGEDDSFGAPSTSFALVFGLSSPTGTSTTDSPVHRSPSVSTTSTPSYFL